jgi:hypothetical protein
METTLAEVVDDCADGVRLLRAYDHRWGKGHIHAVNGEEVQTLCGKGPAACPGEVFSGPISMMNCQACQRAIDAQAKREEAERIREEQTRAREELNRQWWEAYNEYLLTPTWRAKRYRVLRRAGNMCEGCGDRAATQVHHMSYPRDCLPGSPAWIAQEKLFDLRAICTECHGDVHP